MGDDTIVVLSMCSSLLLLVIIGVVVVLLPQHPEWKTLIPGFGGGSGEGDGGSGTTIGTASGTSQKKDKTTKAAAGSGDGGGGGVYSGNPFGPAPNADANARSGDTRCKDVQPGKSKDLVYQEDKNNGMGPWVQDEDPEGSGWCGGQMEFGQPLGSKAYSLYNQCCDISKGLAAHQGCASGCCFDGNCKPRTHCEWAGVHWYDKDGKRVNWDPKLLGFGPMGPDVGKPCKRKGKLSAECWFGECRNDNTCGTNDHFREEPATWGHCWHVNNDSAEKYRRFKDRG